MEFAMVLLVNAAVWAAALRSPPSEAIDRISRYVRRAPRGLRAIELQRSLLDRLLGPVLISLARFYQGRTPMAYRDALGRKLRRAGVDGRPEMFLAARAMAAAGGLVLGLLVAFSVEVNPLSYALFGGAGVLAGFSLPTAVLGRRERSRLGEIREEVPEFLEVVAICLRAGAVLDEAVRQYVGNASGELGKLLRRYLAEVEAGVPRHAAMANLADRADVDEVRTAVGAIVRAMEFGGSLAGILENQAAFFRRIALERATEQAQKLPTKLVIVMVLFIMPALFTILLIPAILSFVREGGLLGR